MSFNSVNGPKIVTNGLVGCWDAASARSSPGGGTTWTDLSKNGNDGTLTNGPTIRTSHGGSVKFDGTDDTITTTFNPENIIGDANPYTICVWVKLNDNQTNADIFGSWYANDKRFYLSVMTGNYYWGLGDTYVSSTNTSAQAGVWQHVSLVFEGGSNNMLMYLDSEQTYNQSYSGNGDCPNELIPIGSAALNAQASLAQIYNRALTAAEIKQNYYATKGRFDTPSIVTDSLVLHLDAGDDNSYPGTGTTWTDLSGEGNNGTLTNGPTFSSSDGGEIVFDGSNDYVGRTTNDFAFTTSFTVDVWVKADTIGSWIRVVDYSFFDGTRNGWCINSYSNSQKYEFRLDTIGNGDGSVISNTITLGEWYHICGVYNSDTNSGLLYENSILVDSQTTSGTETYTNVTDLGIGARLQPSVLENFDGSISSVRIYNKALTAGEILQNYNATKGRFV